MGLTANTNRFFPDASAQARLCGEDHAALSERI